MLKDLVKLYIKAIKDAPKNIEKQIEINKIKEETIKKEYEKKNKK